MNFVKSNVSVVTFGFKIFFYLFLVLVFFFYLGCSDKVVLPSLEKLIEFENAGPLYPTVDLDRLVEAKISGGLYRVIPGEVLELTMPAVLRVVTTDASVGTNEDSNYICRINETGAITIPVIGQIEVAGKTLAQIESIIVDAFYPEYVLTVPSVFARVVEYRTAKVSINGAVKEPGIYSLRSDQMSLVALIMEAGGIIDEGAAVIRIVHSEGDESYSDIGRRYEKFREQQNEQIPKLLSTESAGISTSISNLNEIEVQLSFKQLSEISTIGVLTVAYNDKIILSEQIDIASEIERLVILKQLSWREPRASIYDIGRKLNELAGSLTSVSSGSVINARIVNTKEINTLSDISKARNDSSVMSKEQQPSLKIFAADTINSSKVLHELYKPSYGIYYNTNKTLKREIYSDVDSNQDKSSHNNAIKEELGEILNMVSNQETGGRISGRGSRDSIVLPVEGFNIPFADVELHDGDSVIVERLEQPLFSVVGLVNRPGNFSYPPNVNYNLMQAIAFAGGLDSTADPRYVTVYRLKADGTIVDAAFELIHVGNSAQLTEALSLKIKPGDIVSVEHTPRTRTKVFLDRIFRINLGTYFSLNDMWDD